MTVFPRRYVDAKYEGQKNHAGSFIIGLDLDGVCYEWDKTARHLLNTKIEADGRVPHSTLLDESRSWNALKDAIPPEDWKWLWSDAVDMGLFRYGHIVTGAIEGAKAINRLGQIHIVTSRPSSAVKDTEDWLNLMFDRVDYQELHILSNHESKTSIWPKPDVYIDDALHNVEDILENSDALVILLDRPWNQTTSKRLSERVARVCDWPGIVKATKWARFVGDFKTL